MENLFLEKTAMGKRVSNKPGQWVKEIITYFHEEYPQLVDLPVDVNFTQQNEEKGTAIGSLIIRDWKVALPIIIKDYILSPLDIGVYDGKVLPFNEETLGSLFNNKSAFSSLAPDESTERIRRIFGRDLESIEKISVLKGLNGLINDESLEKVASGSYSAEINDILSNLETSDNVELEFTPDMYMLEKVGQFDYKATFGTDGFDNDRSVLIDSRNIERFKAKMEKLGATEGRSGEYNVKVSSMKPIYGGQVVDFDGNDLGLVLEVDDAGNYGIEKDAQVISQENKDGSFTLKLVPGTKMRQAPIKLKPITGGNGGPKVSNFGSFVGEAGKVSKPVSLEKVAEYERSIEIEAFDGLEIIKIAMIPGISEGVVSEDDDFDYYLPMDTKFVKLGHFVNDFHETANLDEFEVGLHRVLVSDGVYSLQGPEFQKYAELGHQIDGLDENVAKWTLMKLGCPIEEIEKIGEDHIIQNRVKCPISMSEYTEKIGEKLSGIAALDMKKEAEAMEHQGSVDAMLSLGFLSKENLNYFIEQIPAFEHVLGSLAHLLLSVRLGLAEVEESAVESAMSKMSVVVDSLYELGTLLKKRKK